MDSTNKPSSELTEIRNLFIKENLPPENVIEMFLTPGKLDEVKQHIRTETSGNCYFFTKEKGEKIHLLAFINIKDVADIFERLKITEARNEININAARGNALNEFNFLD